MAKGSSAVDGLSRVKSETDQDIKDFAENTMNELLGWYGYDKVNAASEAHDLSVQRAHSKPSSSSSSPQASDRISPKSRHGDISDDQSEKDGSSMDIADNGTLAASSEPVSPTSGNNTILCAWCLKTGLKIFTLKTSDGEKKAFCSELCFDQCRRAAFKKNRVCDWCKHVRHTVNYVDFQDKDHQLQFCSDKCLNQYKMNIFCKETQAYLQMHPHLNDDGSKSATSSSSSVISLITPDLWLKDCKEASNCNDESSEDEDKQIKNKTNNTPQKEDQNYLKNTQQTPLSNPIIDLMKTSSSKCTDEFFPKLVSPIRADVCLPPTELDMTYTSDSRKKNRFSNASKNSMARLERRTSRIKTIIEERFSKSKILGQVHGKVSPVEDRPYNTESSFMPYHPPPPPLINGSLCTNTTRSPSPNVPGMSSTGTGLPPPPPLLNSELLQTSFANSHPFQHPSYNPFTHQQLEAYLASQNGLLGSRLGLNGSFPRLPYTERPFYPSPLSTNTVQAMSNSLMPSPMLMLPYPMIVPLPVPVPVPIPIPLSCFEQTQQKKNSLGDSKVILQNCKSNSMENQARRVDTIINRLMTKCHEEHRNIPVTLDLQTAPSISSKRQSEMNKPDTSSNERTQEKVHLTLETNKLKFGRSNNYPKHDSKRLRTIEYQS